MEEAPGDCHRHHAICGPHFPAAVHIFRDEQFTAKNAARCAVDDGNRNLAENLGQIGLGVVDTIGDLEKSAPLVSRPEIARE
jgi:hypothetical protein